MTQSNTMRAAVLCEVGRIEVRDVPRPVPGPSDVLVKVTAVGLCGTDFHIFAGHANYHTDDFGRPIPFSRAPQILGHEIAGVVAEVGSAVSDLRSGDPVVMDQGLNCLSAGRSPLCDYCATGDSHQCAYYRECGITGTPGGLAEYILVPAPNVIRHAAALDSAQAAITEPLGCIIHASDVAAKAQTRFVLDSAQTVDRSRRVQSILVIGAGPAGLLFIQYLRQVLEFDGLLLVSEPNARKRELAAEFGAEVIDPSATDLVEAVQEQTKGERVEYLIEAAGAGQAFTQIPGLLRKQGTILLYGHGQSGVDLGVLNNIQFLEPTLVAPVGASGGFDRDGRPCTYRRALRLIEAERIKVAPFITHRYTSLEAIPTAFAGAHRAPDYVKGVVVL